MEASALTHKDITNSNMKDILQKNNDKQKTFCLERILKQLQFSSLQH